MSRKTNEVNQINTQEKSTTGRKNGMCKGPEVEQQRTAKSIALNYDEQGEKWKAKPGARS